MRCTASTEPAASRCSASIFLVISSVAFWVCTASAFTSVATTAKPRPASPARAASMVELSASSVVCRAICAIRLTTLPIAAEDSRRRSTLALASRAASLAWSASLPASRTCEPMPCAEWVNLSAACEKVVAVRLRGAGAAGQGVGALADGGERRRGRLGAAGDRIGRALELADHRRRVRVPEVRGFPWPNRLRAERLSVAATAAGTLGSTAGAAGSGTRFRNKPNAMVSLRS